MVLLCEAGSEAKNLEALSVFQWPRGGGNKFCDLLDLRSTPQALYAVGTAAGCPGGMAEILQRQDVTRQRCCVIHPMLSLGQDHLRSLLNACDKTERERERERARERERRRKRKRKRERERESKQASEREGGREGGRTAGRKGGGREGGREEGSEGGRAGRKIAGV